MQINFHNLLWSYLPRVPMFLAMTVCVYIYIYVCVCVYSWSQKFTYTLQNLQNVDYLTKEGPSKPEGFFWRTADSLTVQDKQGTHEQLSLNTKTQQWIIQRTTQY